MQTKHLFVLIHIRNKGEVGAIKMFKPSSNHRFTDRSKAVTLLRILYFICASCLSSLVVPCCLVVTCWENLTAWLSCT